MSSFQTSFLSALGTMLRDRGIQAAESLEGENETYARLAFSHGSDEFEIFVYEDEVGYFLDGEWHAFERQDFATLEDLHEAALEHIRLQLKVARG